MADDKPLLLFVHLRKTAGSTARWVMNRQFGRGEVVEINGSGVEEVKDQWNAMPAGRRAAIQGVRGHLPYASDLFAPRRTVSFTFLRDPVERVVSEYYFNLANAPSIYHRELKSRGLSLDQFVRSDLGSAVHNLQTRMLAGAPPHASGSELLDLAVKNMNQLALPGIAERFDETLLLCGSILGWRHLVYRRVNVNLWRPSPRKIAPETRQAIEERNALDRRLYQLGLARFEELLREHRITESQVRALRRRSLLYGNARRLIGLPREIWIEVGMALARRKAAAELRRSPR